jgi:uncharacterized protein
MLNIPARTVAIIGASAHTDRPSHQALLSYQKRGYTVWPVHPAGGTIADIPVYKNINELPAAPLIMCLYVNPTLGLSLLDSIEQKKPGLLWLNPGADGEPLTSAARARGLNVVEACTLVVLGYGDPWDYVQHNGIGKGIGIKKI